MAPYRLNRRSFASVATLATLGLALAVVLAGPGSAHSILKGTSPKQGAVLREPPDRVVLRFNEPVEVALGGIRVFGPDGDRVDVGETEHVSGDRSRVRVALQPDLANGRYRVAWRIIAADGHPRQGTFRFSINAPQPTASPAAPSPTHAPPSPPGGGMPAEEHQVAGAGRVESFLLGTTRFVTFLSLLLLGGLLVFLVAVWRRPALPERPAEVEGAFAGRFRTLMGWSFGAAALAALASLPLQGAVAADLPLREAASAEIVGAVLGTRFGQVVLVRLFLLLLAGAVWWALLRRPAGRPSPLAVQPRSVGAAALARRAPAGALALLLLAVGLLATIGVAGHAGTTPPVAVNMGADLLHLAGAAAWAGGLVTLAAVAFPATASLRPAERLRTLAPVISRFSDLALVSVGVIVVSGLVRAWMEIRSLSALTGYDYGLALLVKLAVIVPLLALGVVNNRRLKPRIKAAARHPADEETGVTALALLRRLVILEVVLLVVVVGITAVLVNLPPPRLGPDGAH